METQYQIVFLLTGLFGGLIIGAVLTYLLTRGKYNSSAATTADQSLQLEFEGERSRLQTELIGVKQALNEQRIQTNQREAQSNAGAALKSR
jgi:uncharacterized ion transporter superfamily protein YfcC